MTLKTWLSANNVNLQKSKMSGGVSILPISNPHESPTRGCAIPTSCGVLKVRRNKDWKTRSVEDVLESSLEQGDYGFLEYFSLRQYKDNDSHLSGYKIQDSTDTWDGGNKWRNFAPTQFYPGTLNRQDVSSRKRSRKDRSNSILQHDSQSKTFFRSDDLRTSTPLSNFSSFNEENSIMHSLVREKLNEKPKLSYGLLKRNSVLAKLRPDKWKNIEGTLRRSRSRDDVLGSSKKNSLGASQPDLLISHTSYLDASANIISPSNSTLPPAPISILPPTCRNAAANLSQTLPRQRRHSDINRNNTFFARGKRWLTGVTNKENDRNRSNLNWSRRENEREILKIPSIDKSRLIRHPNATFSEPKLVRGATFSGPKTIDNRLSYQGKHPLEQMRCRRPLTFYLLEDYLSPVKATRKIELDEYFDNSPRILFQESLQRPVPVTPEWDIPSLSPQSSVKSNSSRHIEGNNSLIAISPTRNLESKTMRDIGMKSPERFLDKIHSPASSRETDNFSEQATPEQTPPSIRQRNLRNGSSPSLYNRTASYHSTSMQSLPQFSPLQSPSSIYKYSHHLSNKPTATTNGSHPPKQQSFPRTQPHIHNRSQSSSTQDLERRSSNCRDKKRIRNYDSRYKSPGQHKESLQRLGRTANGTRNQEQGKPRQNGLLSTQKLPVLASASASASSSTSSSRINIPLDATRNGVSESDLAGLPGQSSMGTLPALNNNRGELSNQFPGDKYSNKNFGEKTPSPDGVVNGQPMTPQEALRLFGDRLTAFEKKEIEAYPEIWYLGLDARKIHGEEGSQLNGGYDDENGSYNKVMHDHISYRYEILEVIGKGSFGQVIRAIDHRSGDQVAIKIIRNKKRFHHQALVEVKILDHLRRKDKDRIHNVIHMHDYFYFRNHLCITFELMGLNLYELIKKNCYQGFGLSLIRRFAYSLVLCLRLLAKENIIHCDLKPENVLLKERGGTNIRVIDFGSSCYSHQRVYTYIQSRFYRSPEVILGLPYGLPIDMWSLGCILAELYTGYPLFPGENEVEQLACIMEVMGQPPHHLLCHASRRRLFFDSKGHPRCVTNSKGKKRKPGSRDLSSLLKSSDSLFVDFISKCLSWDPSKRLTPDEALEHDWLRGHSSSYSYSSTPVQVSSSSSHSSTLERSNAGSSNVVRRPGPLSGDHGETTDPAAVQYRVYKNKKNDLSCTKNQVGSMKRHEVGSDLQTKYSNNYSKLSQSRDSKEENPHPNPQNPIEAGSENSLDDSGTYLPPIL